MLMQANRGGVVGLFLAQARQRPAAVAIATEDAKVTYAALERWSGWVQRQLNVLGVPPESSIAVLADRSAASFAAMLGIMRAGCIYVPVDPAYPQGRQAYLLQDCGAVVICSCLLAAKCDRPHIYLPDGVDASGQDVPPADCGASAACYLLYTSGSTGDPKGVVVEHGSLLNLVIDHVDRFAMVEADRVMLITSMAFDASIFQALIAWAVGATLWIPPLDVIADPVQMVRWIEVHRMTVLSLPPAYLHTLGRPRLPHVRLINTGGDAAIADDARYYATICRYFSTYGATETTICSAAHEVTVGEQFPDGVPLGTPLRQVSILVRDHEGRACAPGVVGEICIGGVGVARGYLNRPMLTQERFIADPRAEGGRLYRTGDLGYLRDDGALMFRGRADRQVKIRGFRVEPEEVERRLQSLAGVDRAVVVVVGADSRSRQIHAFVVGAATLDAAVLRRALAAELPAYAMPSRLVVLPEFPQTAHGKVDHDRLRSWDGGGAPPGASSAAPPDGLLGLFQQVLGGPFDASLGFFELGGDSLGAARLMTAARIAFGRQLPIRMLLEGAAVLDVVSAAQPVQLGAGSVASRLRDADGYPASHAQRRLWLIHQMHGGSVAYNICHGWEIEGPLDAARLGAALQRVVERHEALRTTFVERAGVLLQAVSAVARTGWREVADTVDPVCFVAEEAGFAFDLCRGPLVRASLLRLDGQRAVFVLNIHHAVCDGLSFRLIVDELSAAYRDPQADPTPLALQLRDICSWQLARLNGPQGERASAYWRTVLGAGDVGAPLQLTTDRPRPARPSYRGGLFKQSLPQQLVRGLLQLARQSGASLFMVVVALTQALLFRETRQTDIALGAPMSERDDPVFDGQVGFYVNTVVLRQQLSGQDSFLALLGRTRERCIDAQTHVVLPFDQLVDSLGIRRDPSRSPLFDVMVALQLDKDQALVLPGLRCRSLSPPGASSKFDLSLDFVQTGQGLDVEFEYATDLFDGERVQRLSAHLIQLARAIVVAPTAALDALEILPPEELAAIRQWGLGRPLQDVPAAELLAIYRHTAREHPRRTALVCGHICLSYAALAEEVSGLARRIDALLTPAAAGPVAVMLDRDERFFISALAIVDRGRAYLPIDPQLPADRVRYMLADSGSVLLISRGELIVELASPGVPSIDLDAPTDAPASAPMSQVASDDIAYVIYTSGSTGLPKGVAVGRDNLCHATRMWLQDYALKPPVVLQLLSFAFDVSVGDLGRSLLCGGTLVVAREDERINPAAIYRLAEEYGVNFVEMTPLIARRLADYLEQLDKTMPPLAFFAVSSDIWRYGDMLALRRRLAPGTRLIGSYGTTETTIDSSFFECRAAPDDGATPADAIVPIGRPMSGVELLILDAAGNSVGIGTPGELYIAGSSLSRGYVNQPELTRERFVAHPWAPERQAYRTGDLASWMPDGNIAIIGRLDQQLKIRGYRVELGEIERLLLNHPDVHDAVVVATGDGRQATLTACLVGPGDDQLADIEDSLAARLPHYMLPSGWLLLAALPMNASGKVDRKWLKERVVEADVSRRARVEPRTERERTLYQVWQSVLVDQKEPFGVTDSFFSLGGDSIQVIELALALRAVGFDVTARQLFRHPTIAGCAATLSAAAARLSPPQHTEVPPAIRRELWGAGDQQLYPATAMQTLMLEADLRHFARDRVYRDLTVWELRDDSLDIDQLVVALRHEIHRQTALRTCFACGADGRWYQRVRPADAVTVMREDCSDVSLQAQAQRVEEIAEALAGARFEWAQGEPACRFAVVRRGADEATLIMVAHHAAEDGWGAVAFENAVLEHYDTLKGGGAAAEAAPLATCRQYVALEDERLADDDARGYWSEVVAQLPPSPYARPRPRSDDVRRFGRLYRVVPKALAAARIADAERVGWSFKAACLAAFLQTVAADAEAPKSSAWVVSNGRSERLDASLEAMGLFWNIVPVALVSGSDGREGWRYVENALREADRRGAWFYPDLFGKAATCGYPICFNYTHFRRERVERAGIQIKRRTLDNVFHFALTLAVSRQAHDGAVVLRACHDRWIFGDAHTEALLGAMLARLEGMAQNG